MKHRALRDIERSKIMREFKRLDTRVNRPMLESVPAEGKQMAHQTVTYQT